MSNHGKPDHWQSLASDLGAEVPPEPDSLGRASSEEEFATPDGTSASESTPTTVAGARRGPRPPRPPRPRADWLELAEELGVAPETPPAPPEIQAKPLPKPPAETSACSETPDWLERQPLVDPLEEAPLPEPSARVAPADDSEKGAEQKLPRRRKKRRRRPRESKPPAELFEGQEKAESTECASTVEATPEPAEEVFAGEPGAEIAAERRVPSDSVAGGSKRRRRGRGGRKKSSASNKPMGDASETGSDDMTAEPLSDVEPGDKPHHDAVESPHRGIPSWEESVGVVIAANLEARSKRSSKEASPRGRGSRARGGKDKNGSKQTKSN